MTLPAVRDRLPSQSGLARRGRGGWLSALPLETWAIAVPAILVLVLLRGPAAAPTVFVSQLIDALVGGRFLYRALTIVYPYLVIRAGLGALRAAEGGMRRAGVATECLVVARSAAFWLALLAFGTLSLSSSLSFLFSTVPPARIAGASAALLHADLAVFGTYPSGFLNARLAGSSLAQHALLVSYGRLSTIVSAVMLVLLFTGTRRFRQFFISFFVVYVLALPIWLAVPAVSPREYVDLAVVPVDGASIAPYKTTPAPVVAESLPVTDKLWVDPSGRQFSVSSFPSMHAAWALLVVLVLASLAGASLAVSVPWLVALLVGAVLLYQHYGVDMIAGIVLGAVVFRLVDTLLAREERFFTDPYRLMYVPETFASDGKAVVKLAGRMLRSLSPSRVGRWSIRSRGPAAPPRSAH